MVQPNMMTQSKNVLRVMTIYKSQPEDIKDAYCNSTILGVYVYDPWHKVSNVIYHVNVILYSEYSVNTHYQWAECSFRRFDRWCNLPRHRMNYNKIIWRTTRAVIGWYYCIWISYTASRTIPSSESYYYYAISITWRVTITSTATAARNDDDPSPMFRKNSAIIIIFIVGKQMKVLTVLS